jgi:hypothetical protein
MLGPAGRDVRAGGTETLICATDVARGGRAGLVLFRGSRARTRSAARCTPWECALSLGRTRRAAHSPSASSRRSSTRSARARPRAWLTRASERALPWRANSLPTRGWRRRLCRRGKDHGAGEPGGAGRSGRQFFDDLSDRGDVLDRSAAHRSDVAGGVAPVELLHGAQLQRKAGLPMDRVSVVHAARRSCGG